MIRDQDSVYYSYLLQLPLFAGARRVLTANAVLIVFVFERNYGICTVLPRP